MREVVKILCGLRDGVTWRPGKEIEHLERRIAYGHLPKGTSLLAYRDLIKGVVARGDARVYAYRHGEVVYAAAVADVAGRDWLVMAGPDGTMETAFAIERQGYLDGERWEFLGTIADLEDR